jgi:hypothetical protein
MNETYFVHGGHNMPFYGRDLILIVGGNLQPGERVKGYLRRVAKLTGIGDSSIEKTWKGQYSSRKTIQVLQQAATKKTANDNDKLISQLENKIAAWEWIDPHHHRPDIDAARGFIDRLRRYAETEVYVAVPTWNDDGREG